MFPESNLTSGVESFSSLLATIHHSHQLSGNINWRGKKAARQFLTNQSDFRQSEKEEGDVCRCLQIFIPVQHIGCELSLSYISFRNSKLIVFSWQHLFLMRSASNANRLLTGTKTLQISFTTLRYPSIQFSDFEGLILWEIIICFIQQFPVRSHFTFNRDSVGRADKRDNFLMDLCTLYQSSTLWSSCSTWCNRRTTTQILK